MTDADLPARVKDALDEAANPTYNKRMDDEDVALYHLDIARRLAAIVREQQARIKELTTWRPMETAPRDGTEFLLLWEDGFVEIDWWRKGMAPSFEAQRWRNNSGAAKDFMTRAGWLPLPPAPTKEGA